MDRADDEVVVPAGKGLFGRLQILVGLAQLDAPVEPGAPSLGDFQGHFIPGLFHPGAVAFGELLALAVVGEGVGPQAQLLGAAAHLQHGVVPIGGTAGVVVAVTGKTITQKAALLSGVGRAGKARFFQDAWVYLTTIRPKREGRMGKT